MQTSPTSCTITWEVWLSRQVSSCVWFLSALKVWEPPLSSRPKWSNPRKMTWETSSEGHFWFHMMCALCSLACMQMFRLIWKRLAATWLQRFFLVILLLKWRVSRRNTLGQKRILIVLWFLSLFHLFVERGAFLNPMGRRTLQFRFAPEDPQEMAWCRILDKGHGAEHKANEDYTMLDSFDWHSNIIRMQETPRRRSMSKSRGWKAPWARRSHASTNKDSAATLENHCKVFSLKLS